MHRSYLEIRTLSTFEERFEYLKLGGEVGDMTFANDRVLNQNFYATSEWKKARRDAILRDRSCDLGVPGYEVYDYILVHHINPLTVDDFMENSSKLLSLDNLITTTLDTHNAIHYGSELPANRVIVDRQPGDTKLW